jgi:23S rRNA (guanosine2251-2'-O)-methyltransferase
MRIMRIMRIMQAAWHESGREAVPAVVSAQRTTTVWRYHRGVSLPVHVVLHQVRSLYNVGAFFRTADGAGVREMVLSGITARPPRKEIAKTALGAEESVPWRAADDLLAWMDDFAAAGGQLAAIETASDAIDLFDWTPTWPLAVLFGHEVDGLPPDLLARCHVRVRIPMYGTKGSLNVATAAGVVLYELVRKHRTRHASP